MDKAPDDLLYAVNPSGPEPGAIYDPVDDAVLVKVGLEHLAAAIESGKSLHTLGDQVFMKLEDMAPIAGYGDVVVAAVRGLMRAKFADAVH